MGKFLTLNKGFERGICRWANELTHKLTSSSHLAKNIYITRKVSFIIHNSANSLINLIFLSEPTDSSYNYHCPPCQIVSPPEWIKTRLDIHNGPKTVQWITGSVFLVTNHFRCFLRTDDIPKGARVGPSKMTKRRSIDERRLRICSLFR